MAEERSGQAWQRWRLVVELFAPEDRAGSEFGATVAQILAREGFPVHSIRGDSVEEDDVSSPAPTERTR